MESEKKTKLNSDVIPAERWCKHFKDLFCAPKRNDFNNGIDEMISKLKSEPRTRFCDTRV